MCTRRRLGVNERAPPDGRARAQGRGIETERRDSCLLAAVYVPELRRASSRVLRPCLASRRRPASTVEHADGYTSQTGTQLHISQTAGVHAWDVHIADEARMIGSASIFALAPLALRRPLHGTWGAVRAAVG